MDPNAVPTALRERLGAEGTNGLVQLLETARGEWSADVVTLSVERFERRLVQELSALRVEVARGQAAIHEALVRECAALRVEIAGVCTELKSDMQEGFAAARREITDSRFELLKWSFLFWVGQVIAIVGLIGVMLRGLGLR